MKLRINIKICQLDMDEKHISLHNLYAKLSPSWIMCWPPKLYSACSFCLVDNLRLKQPSTWMPWTNLRTHGTCRSHMQELSRTQPWRHGEAAQRTWRRHKMHSFSVPSPTHLLSLESTLVRVNLRKPRRNCLSKATPIKMFVSSEHEWYLFRQQQHQQLQMVGVDGSGVWMERLICQKMCDVLFYSLGDFFCSWFMVTCTFTT